MFSYQKLLTLQVLASCPPIPPRLVRNEFVVLIIFTGAPHDAFLSTRLLYFPSDLNILLSTLFSNTLRLCSSLNVKDGSFTPIQNNRQDYSSVYVNLYVFT
jgi:hypothetical protein